MGNLYEYTFASLQHKTFLFFVTLKYLVSLTAVFLFVTRSTYMRLSLSDGDSMHAVSSGKICNIDILFDAK